MAKNSKPRIKDNVMQEQKINQPPKWATQFLRWYCKPELLEDLQGDLNEYFDRNLQTKGPRLARLIYIIDVLKFLRLYTARMPSFRNPVIKRVMVESYIKTSGRAIVRSKLFSGINIIGLAISMSVGLLVVAFVSDFLSYDKTIKNKDRIYRISSSDVQTGEQPMRLATTSWKAGELIKQRIPGVEAIAFLRRGFWGDVKTGETILPLTAVYADEGFFKVFSYTLLKGDAGSALKEPYSLVLTQTTAKKLFGDLDPMGKVVKIDTLNYTITGLLQDLPALSHMKFEALVSMASIDVNRPEADGGDYMSWTNIYSHYVYVLLSKNATLSSFTGALQQIDGRENASLKSRKIILEPQALKKITIGKPLANELGPVINISVVYTLAALALVIILSACFNYTNLSIARSLSRSREVGIRKVVGARKSQVLGQLITESVMISLFALCFAVFIFFILRAQFLSLVPELTSAYSLELSPHVGWFFILLAITVGVIAGLLPALFYSKINAVQVLKDASSLKAFRHVSLRKALVVIQYTFSLIFITATIIGYKQYKGLLRFDLGFSTKDVLNIKMQGNKDDVLIRELSAMTSVKAISKSEIISSLGNIYGAKMKYKDPLDSADVDINYIDENYLRLHSYKLLAGQNFIAKPKNTPETQVIVNEELIRRFNIGYHDPAKAIGETITISGSKLMIIGVLKDFHYGTLENRIDPTAFRYSPEPGGWLNIKIVSSNIPATLAAIEGAWKKIDSVHPFDAAFYDDQIEHAYRPMSVTLKVIGFFAFLAISISSMGMFGMVIYTMEKRLKEISIRKVLGATEGMLVYLLSKGFLVLLFIAALIAIPLTVLFFDKVALANFAYHVPIHFGEIFIGLFIVAAIAFLMIGIQTSKIVRSNPARVLKNE